MHRRALAVPRYLAAHAAMGALLGVLLGAVLVGTDVVGLRAMAARDPVALILVPAFACLFATAAGATALALLGSQGEEGIRARGVQESAGRLAALRISVRR